MAAIVYMLCAVTSLVCAFLLLKSYWRNHTSLLLWSGIFFSLLAVSNVLLFVDLVMVPEVDLSLFRTGIVTVAHFALIISFALSASKQ